MQWTKEEDELLKKLHVEQGLSASLVAAQMRGKTRNAVIGRIHRLGLPRRGPQSSIAHKRRVQAGKALPNVMMERIVKAQKVDRPPLVIEPYTPPQVEETPLKTFATLERGDCRWPIGDPSSNDFGFCGCPSVPHQSYCEVHRKRAYAAIPVSRKERVTVPAEVCVREKEGVS